MVCENTEGMDPSLDTPSFPELTPEEKERLESTGETESAIYVFPQKAPGTSSLCGEPAKRLGKN